MASVAYTFVEGEVAKRPFSPLSPDEAAGRLRDIVAQSPRSFQLEQTRWTLQAILRICRSWIRMISLVGLWRLIQRFGLRHKRGRLYVHSPDPNYARKRQRIAEFEAQVRAQPQRYVLLYLDEFTYTRQPTLANDYAPCGHTQPLAHIGYRSNYDYRILAAVNALTGRVHYLQRNRIKVATLRDFWRQICAAYPHAEQIYIVVDNWPVHYHPDGLAILQPQPFAADFILPPSWPVHARASLPQENLPICLLPLPTYASWLNPIEKLWRWLRQTVLHLHPYIDDVDALRAEVDAFLDRFALGSRSLLHYIGILPI